MKSVAPLFLSFGLGGCAAVGPDYRTPEIETPASFGERDATSVSADEIARWWEVLDDPTLTELVNEVLAANLDLGTAVERVLAARATLRVSRSEFLPTVEGAGSYLRNRPFGLPNVETQDLWSAGGDLFWEIDLFGRIRRSVEASRASLEAEVEDLRGVQVALAAETVATYLQAVSLEERLGIAERNVEAQERSLDIANRRFEGGMAAGLDPAQARVNLFTSRASIPALRLGLRQAKHRLAVLAGQEPRALLDRVTTPKELPPLPGELMVGVPADLLRNRPDIRAAERRLAAQTAQVGVATAALYPSINLSATWDWLAEKPADLFGGDDTEAGSFGPLVTIPVFNAGRLRSRRSAEEAAMRQLDLQLRQRVLVAQEEVENALVAVVRDRRQVELLRDAVGAARESVDLSRLLYTSGQSDFQNVLDAQRSLFALEDDVALANLSVMLDVVDLYRALGGGWTP